MLQGVQQSSKLCQDVLELEKAFKYNLFLLELKDKEIERCTAVNKQLENALILKTQETAQLNSKIMHLQTKCQNFITEMSTNSQEYDNNIQGLKKNIQQLKNENEKQQIHAKRHNEAKDAEVQRNFREIIKQKEMKYQKIIDKMHANLGQETNEIEKMKENLQELLDENMSLRSTSRDQVSEYSFKVSILETELNSCKSDRDKFKNCLQSSEDERNKLQNDVTNLKTSYEDLKVQIKKDIETQQKQLKDVNKYLSENENLKEKIIMYEQKLIETIQNSKKLEHENQGILEEIQNLKRMYCAIPDHSNYTNLCKQNEILRQVIKNMKNERIANDSEFDSNLKSIEAMVNTLKSNLLLELHNTKTNEKDDQLKMC